MALGHHHHDIEQLRPLNRPDLGDIFHQRDPHTKVPESTKAPPKLAHMGFLEEEEEAATPLHLEH